MITEAPQLDPVKVAILMTDLDDLGVQRVVINLFNHFDRNRVKPTLVLCWKKGKVANFLKPDGKVYETDPNLPRPRFFFRLWRYIKILHEIEPEVILSCVPQTNVSMFLIRKFIPKGVKFIACEHAFISRAFATSEYPGYFGALYRILMKRMYNYYADNLIMTAEVGKADAIENWGIFEDKIKVIHNPQDSRDLIARSMQRIDDSWFDEDTSPIIIAAGRLCPQKGFDKLLKAISIVLKTREVKLAILGRGESENELRKLSNELGLGSQVQFLGFRSNHLAYIKRANLFVLSSVWEAMPMVLAETMVVGTPIVSFDCPSGPREMLDAGDCGYLVEDQNIEALAKAIVYALDSPAETNAKSKCAAEKAKTYDVTKIVREYETLLSDVSRYP